VPVHCDEIEGVDSCGEGGGDGEATVVAPGKAEGSAIEGEIVDVDLALALQRDGGGGDRGAARGDDREGAEGEADYHGFAFAVEGPGGAVADELAMAGEVLGGEPRADMAAPGAR